jgi:hypothetical protein
MTVRKEVRSFVDLGPLPPEDTASEAEVREAQHHVEAITPPVSREEVTLLIGSFRRDTCFGLAWTLLHLIESGPNPAIRTEPTDDTNEWIKLLWRRAQHLHRQGPPSDHPGARHTD